MTRPDQARFDMFAQHFAKIDGTLAQFCASRGFVLERNLLRQPGRVLRRKSNPEYLIDISLSTGWLEANYELDMPHNLTAFAYYVPSNSVFIWRMKKDVESRIPFTVLQSRLVESLEEAQVLCEKWSPQVIMERGERIENLRLKYRV